METRESSTVWSRRTMVKRLAASVAMVWSTPAIVSTRAGRSGLGSPVPCPDTCRPFDCVNWLYCTRDCACGDLVEGDCFCTQGGPCIRCNSDVDCPEDLRCLEFTCDPCEFGEPVNLCGEPCSSRIPSRLDRHRWKPSG